MRKIFGLSVILFLSINLIAGCGVATTPEAEKEVQKTAEKTSAPIDITEIDEAVEVVEVAEGDELAYIEVVAAEASSFDQTPDWAPEPNPMAPVDGDMLTRWSSDYEAGEQWIYFDLGR